MSKSKKIQQDAMNRVLEPTQGMSTDSITTYLSMVLGVAIVALRGIAGEKYVEDYLTAAINDPTKPKIEKVKTQ